MTPQHETWLKQLTALPTAAGHERHIADWIRRWVGRRPEVRLCPDRFGNLHLSRAGVRSSRPIYITAHMDHPAFVVRRVLGPRRLEAEFRGGVEDRYFRRAGVVLHQPGRPPCAGRVVGLRPAATEHDYKLATVAFPTAVPAVAGDLLTWDVGPVRLQGDRLHAPACDDLAAVAAALGAFDLLMRRPARKGARRGTAPDVRLLFTRAEEVGFIGAIAACKAGALPRGARLLALEVSRSYPESPIGGGPILRVGDKTSTFDPDLTYRIAQIAGRLAQADPSFKWQRKLMPGGTCEASAYGAYGYTATCLCLPLGNYHNQNFDTGRIDAEVVSRADFHGLVRLLAAVARQLDEPDDTPPLRRRLDWRFAGRRKVLRDAI